MRSYLILLLISIIFFLAGAWTLSDYGVNWDSQFRFMRGQAYAHFFLTGQNSFPGHLNPSPVLIKPGEFITRFGFHEWEGDKFAQLSKRPLFERSDNKISFFEQNDWNEQYIINSKDSGHPPLIDILSAFSNKIFWRSLGWFEDLDSYHIPGLFFSSIGVLIVAAFTYQITRSTRSGQAGSWVAASVAGLSLAFYPAFFAESHFNIKDPVQASFFAGSIWAFWNWVKDNKLSFFGVFVVFVALALSVKWNIVFLPLIILPWLVIIRFKSWGRLWKLGGLGILGVFLFLIAIWPYLWADPLTKLWDVVKYYQTITIGADAVDSSSTKFPNLYPLLLLISQTPEIILILGVIGIIGGIRGIRGDKIKTGYLLLLWLLIPIIRMISSGNYYAGVRQMMEVVPALAVLAGVGGSYIISTVIPGLTGRVFRQRNLHNKWIPASAGMTMMLITFFLLLVPIIRLHPYENLYHNSLNIKVTDWALDYGTSFKQAIKWLNQHVQKDADLAILNGFSFAASPVWLRGDISMSPNYFSGFERKGEYLFYYHSPLSPRYFAYYYPIVFLKPVYIISVSGTPILSIFKNEPSLVKAGFDKEAALANLKTSILGESNNKYIEVDLAKNRLVTRITLLGAGESCQDQYSRLSDEFIAFVKEQNYSKKVEAKDLYVLTERKKTNEGKMEFWFAADEARYIRIYPQSEFSCFIKGRIVSVSILDNIK